MVVPKYLNCSTWNLIQENTGIKLKIKLGKHCKKGKAIPVTDRGGP
jgi:hypothetical protein